VAGITARGVARIAVRGVGRIAVRGVAGITALPGRRYGAARACAAARTGTSGECERLQFASLSPARLRLPGPYPVLAGSRRQRGTRCHYQGGADSVSRTLPGTGNAYRRPPGTARIRKRGPGAPSETVNPVYR
jgi:hypothetical protein